MRITVATICCEIFTTEKGDNMKDRKENGVYYTPQVLAEYLANPLITANTRTILDPSYGEGSLLLAAERIFKKKNNSSEIQLFGCDTKPVNGLLKHLPEANLKETDFFTYQPEILFQTILMNPPYVRYQTQNIEKIKKYRNAISEFSILNNKADLWAYFLLKASLHLEKDGNIGAILPWAFLQADYSVPLRKWIVENFHEIKAVALSNKYFDKADERVVVIWLKGYGKKNESIKIAASKSLESEITFSDLPMDNWVSDRVFYSDANSIDHILSRYKNEFGYMNFINYADVKIGVVTGAVDYFIMPKQKAKETGFSADQLVPILTNPDEFSQYLSNGEKNLLFLISIKEEDYAKHIDYIQRGIEHQYHLRSHSLRRKPWYSIQTGKTPDAFFHYRVSKTPYMVLNCWNTQSTNSIHRIYFKDLSEVEKKWIFVSFLSRPSQLSLEAKSKTYGRGILKIEPKTLKDALVIKRSDPCINSVYKKVTQLLSSGQKVKAVDIASEFINKELGIPYDLKILTEETLSTLQNLRLQQGK